MNKNIEEEKHALAVLVEVVLYGRVCDIDSNDRPGLKQEIIEKFIQENRARFSSIPYEEYVQYINFVLERTENNIKEINKNRRNYDMER